MKQIVFDDTYHGWLTAIFEIYEYKIVHPVFSEGEESTFLFGSVHTVYTDEIKAFRVLNGLKKKLSSNALNALFNSFMSSDEQRFNNMFQFVKLVFESAINIETDLGNPIVLSLFRMAKKVRKEAHYMKAFVRFKQTQDQLYYSFVEPEHNVLPLIAKHFLGRYADQRWLIYDLRRKYGFHYDLKEMTVVELSFSEEAGVLGASQTIYDEKEEFYQTLWNKYFKSVNIQARKNSRLQMRNMPKRYWKHLTEMIPKIDK